MPEGGPDNLAPLRPLRRLRIALTIKVRTVQQAEDRERLRAWRSWLEEAWSTDQGAVYQWLKDESYAPPVTFLSRPDGTGTANLGEMDGLLQDALRLVNRKYADSPEPEPVALLRRCGHHVRRVPMVASQLACRRLWRGLARMHPSALGLDGWSLADLRSLPDQLLTWLADLLREVERVGRWPARLAEGYAALIPRMGRWAPSTPAPSPSCPWCTGRGPTSA